MLIKKRESKIRSIHDVFSSKTFDVLSILTLSLFAFFLSFKSGERGFFPLDYSFFFDGAYRMFSGQIPYKDFLTPYNLTGLSIQAFFFKLFGVNYFAFLLCGASINVIATLLSIFLLRLLFPSHRFLSYSAGLLTAAWFVSPSSILWHGQAAFFFSLLSIVVIVYAARKKRFSTLSQRSLFFISGCLVFLSFLSKQSAALLLFPLYFLLLIAATAPRWKDTFFNCISFISGFLVSVVLFTLWTWQYSDLEMLYRYFLLIPAKFGLTERINFESQILKKIFLKKIFFSRGTIAKILLYFTLPFSLIAISTIFNYLRHFKRLKNEWRFPFISAILCLYFIYSQNLYISFLKNQPEIAYVFLGIIFATSVGVFLHLFHSFLLRRDHYQQTFLFIQNSVKRAIILFLALSIFLFTYFGIKVSWSRYVHDIFKNAKFSEYIDIEKLKCLKWGKPTLVGGVDVTSDDVMQLYDYLKIQNKNFFIFPDFTFFYGILEVPSPQPLVAFYEELTFSLPPSEDLDAWIVKDLRKNKVEIVIIEERRFGSKYKYKKLDNFTRLKAFVNENFVKSKTIGIFNIYEKKKIT